jgi:hypothetical protein
MGDRIMEARRQRGLEIAATAKIAKKGGAWLVPSQSGKGRYTVCLDPAEPHCSCPDHEEGGFKCSTSSRSNTSFNTNAIRTALQRSLI